MNKIRREFLRMGLGAEERIAKVWDVYLRLTYSGHQASSFVSEHTHGQDHGSSFGPLSEVGSLSRMVGRKRKKHKEYKAEKDRLFRMHLESRKPYWFSSLDKHPEEKEPRTYLLPPFGNLILQEGDWGSFVAFGMSTREYLKEIDFSRRDVEPEPKEEKENAEGGDETKSTSFFSLPTLFNTSSAFSSSSSSVTSSTSSYAPSETTVLGASGEVVTWPPPPLPDFRCSITRKSTEEVLAAADEGFGLLSVLSMQSLPLTPTSVRTKNASTSAQSEGDDEDQCSSIGSRKEGKENSPLPPSAWANRNGIKDVTAVHDRPEPVAGEDELLLLPGDGEDVMLVPSIETFVASAANALSSSVTTSSEISAVPSLVTPPSAASTSSTFNTLTNGLSQAMKFMLTNAAEFRPVSPFSSPQKATPSSTRRPHIQYTFSFSPSPPSSASKSSKQKTKQFSLTMYYASQFHSLRSSSSSSCNLSHVSFLRSLSQTTNWIAEGGKSKSDFWKTVDGRYVIKSLVKSLWGVRDLGVLVGIGERWSEYLSPKSETHGATVLAKLFGFYTIEIRNAVEGGGIGELDKKVDLLVMENLFYGRKVERMFDLKGIVGRRRILTEDKQKDGTTPQTLFDAEWNDNQQNIQTAILIQPHSRELLLQAIRNDADFLARSNIMDYSLLLGIDRDKKEIVCGLVDFIGSYTLAKTLEYKAKQGLVLNSISSAASGGKKKEVTVIPPSEYQERFVSAMESYFVACPDKWSNLPEHGGVDQLGNVL